MGKRSVLRLGLVALALVGSLGLAEAQVINGPPGPRREMVPPPPPGPPGAYAWQPGYWRWTGSAYVWVAGHYAHPPRPHAHWVAGHWAHRPSGWVWIDGRWR
jgi:hypothetical protein